MSSEHHEIMVVTIRERSIKARDCVSQTTPFAHVTKIVAEILGWFELHFFSDRIGRLAALRNSRALEKNVPWPQKGAGRICLKPADFVNCFWLYRCRELEF